MHIGNQLKKIATEQRLSQTAIANMRKITPQAVSNDFRSEKVGMSSIYEYAEIFKVPVEKILQSDITNENLQKSSDYNLIKENSDLRKEVAGLWRIIALSGIKVDSSQLNFNLGVSVSAFGF